MRIVLIGSRYGFAARNLIGETEAEPESRNQALFCATPRTSRRAARGGFNGPSAKDLKDQWGYAIQPTDLTAGVFKGGHNGKEIYKRIATGMDGTPMPAYGDDLFTGKDRWALVHYIQSLARGLVVPSQ